MKQLNFFPYYEELLKSGKKTTTFRMRNLEGYEKGDKVEVTVGWTLEGAKLVKRAEITSVYEKQLGEFDEKDFEGESPDCKFPQPTAFVLGAIYRTIVTLEDVIYVVKFRNT